jgi:hypothetical protein
MLANVATWVKRLKKNPTIETWWRVFMLTVVLQMYHANTMRLVYK